MSASDAASGRASFGWRILATAVAYFLGARLASVLLFPGTNVGLFWPPAGVALALMWWWGVRTWPGIALGAFAQALVTLLPAHPAGVALAVAAGEAAADVAPVVLGVVWMRRALGGAEPLGSVRGVQALVVWGGLAAQGVAAALGASTLWAAGILGPTALLGVALHWWLSNVVSVAVLTPLLLAWRPPLRLDRTVRHAAIYGAVAAASLLAAAGLPLEWRGPLRFAAILLVLAAAFDLGVRGATVIATILGGLVIGEVAAGRPVYGPMPVEHQFLLLNLYLATLALTGLLVSAVLDERASATRRHAEREAMLRSILEASPIPIGFSRRDGGIEYWNPRAVELFGWTLEDLPTMEAWFRRAYPDPAYRAQLSAEWARKSGEAARTGGDIVFAELAVTCKDGRVVPAELRARLAGERVLVIFSDLTDRRRTEAQWAALQDELARAQRMESVGRLAGGIAHDFNNMLAPILGIAGALLQDAKGKPEADDLAEIKAAAERARALTRQLLTFGGKQKMQLRVVDLRQALAGVEGLLRRVLREDVRVEVRSPPSLGLVRVDVGRIEQVLMNLAVNAQQAMPRGGSLVIALDDVHAGEGEALPEGDWVHLSVADTGVGMEPAVLERAFDPFFTTRKAGEGSGLGLAMVHGIVGQHGGLVRAESALGRGSTFHVYLPRARELGPEDEPETAPPPALDAAGPAERVTVLVAEDEAAVRRVTTRMLERLGHRVIATESATACLQAAAEAVGPVDLLLTDVVMPDLDGHQLLERLREARPGLKVLFMSGYPGDVVTLRGVPLDGLPLLQKPFTAEALADAVRKAMAG